MTRREVRSPPCGTCSRLRDAALPSLHGVQEDVFPRFSGTMECSDSLPPISPRFVAFVWRYHRLRRNLLPAIATRDRGHRGVGRPGPEPEMTMEAAGSPRFLGNPCVPMPCSWTPVGSRTPGHRGVSTWPPLVSTTKAPAIEGFGARSHGLGTGCLRFAVRIAPPHARLASGCLAKPGRAGLVTRRVATKGFRVRASSPFPKLSWRYDPFLLPGRDVSWDVYV